MSPPNAPSYPPPLCPLPSCLPLPGAPLGAHLPISSCPLSISPSPLPLLSPLPTPLILVHPSRLPLASPLLALASSPPPPPLPCCPPPRLPIAVSPSPSPCPPPSCPPSPGSLPAPQSRMLQLLLSFCSFTHLRWRLRPTAPSPHSSSGDFTSILQISAR